MSTYKMPSLQQVCCATLLAFILWAAIFGFKIVNFWAGLSVAAGMLMGLSLYWAGLPMHRAEISVKNTLLALGSAAVLYGIFAACKTVAPYILPFASEQVASIYTIQHEASPGVIVLILLFLTSPCEELFWRGFMQRFTMHRYGPRNGWLIASALYAAVHVASGNLMLTGAALVAGLFWGYMYMRWQSLYVCILSHASWTIAVFLLWPLQ